MSTASPTFAAAASNLPTDFETRRRLFRGLAAILVVVAIVAIVTVIGFAFSGNWPSASHLWASWYWVPELLVILLAIAAVLWSVRYISGGPMAPGRAERRLARRRRGTDAGRFGPDSAVIIARERFARGEISKEQMDRLLSQLGEGSGTVPP